MPSVNVVNGKQIVVVDVSPVDRVVSFFAKPFRQNVAPPGPDPGDPAPRGGRALQGLGGRLGLGGVHRCWRSRSIRSPFPGRLQLPERYIVTADKNLSYALFILSGIVVFNFWSEMAFRPTMLLHDTATSSSRRSFPATCWQ